MENKLGWEDIGIIANLLRKYEPQYNDALNLYEKVAAEYNKAISKAAGNAVQEGK
jgi:hypothetical protein